MVVVPFFCLLLAEKFLKELTLITTTAVLLSCSGMLSSLGIDDFMPIFSQGALSIY